MPIVGIGIDIVHIPRISGLVKRYGNRFLRRAYHSEEIKTYATKGGLKAIEYLASRWAVKEATYKALGGLNSNSNQQFRIPFPEIRVGKDDFGKPCLSLEGQAKQVMDHLQIKRSFIAISHEKEYAIANVIFEG